MSINHAGSYKGNCDEYVPYRRHKFAAIYENVCGKLGRRWIASVSWGLPGDKCIMKVAWLRARRVQNKAGTRLAALMASRPLMHDIIPPVGAGHGPDRASSR